MITLLEMSLVDSVPASIFDTHDRWHMTYAELETALSLVFNATSADEVSKLRGRYKHFQKLGLPFGRKPGRGSKIKFTLSECCQILLALQLSEIGFDPTLVIVIMMGLCYDVQINGKMVALNVVCERVIHAENRKRGDDVLLVIFPYAMSARWREERIEQYLFYWLVDYVTIVKLIETGSSSGHAAVVVNLSSLAYEFACAGGMERKSTLYSV